MPDCTIIFIIRSEVFITYAQFLLVKFVNLSANLSLSIQSGADLCRKLMQQIGTKESIHKKLYCISSNKTSFLPKTWKSEFQLLISFFFAQSNVLWNKLC